MNELISRLQAPRSIRSHLGRLLVVRVVGSTLLVATVLFGQSLAMQPSGAELNAVPALTPTWTLAESQAHPGCVDADVWPANTLGSAVVAYGVGQAVARRVAFDHAWEVNHNASEGDNLTVIGICA